MSGRQVSSSDVMRAPLPPTAGTEEEAARQHGEEVAAAQAAQASSSTASAPTGPPGEEDWLSGVASSVSGAVDAVADAVATAGQSIGEGLAGMVSGASSEAATIEQAISDWYAQAAPARVTLLYGALGKTDAFVEAVYGDPVLVAAALQLADPNQVIGFFGSPSVSAANAVAFPAKAVAQWESLMTGVSRGAAMPAEVRAGLRKMLPGMSLDQAKKAFMARFSHPIQDEEAAWTLDNLIAVWSQLDLLPDSDVAENTILTAFTAISGGGAFGPSWEAPESVNTIQMGQDVDPIGLGHTVRHEVGHGVHAQIPGIVNPWLQNEIGFWFYSGKAGFERWISEIGGFPGDYTDAAGACKAFGAGEKAKVVAMLSSYVGGGGSWSPARGAVDEGQTPEDAALWAAMPQTVKDAVTKSPAHWYTNYSSWQTGSRGKYFLNYWYYRPFFMSPTAEAVVNATGDDYTAMSEKEFFANAYAEYFEDPAGYSDHSKWGGSLPASVKDFFAQHIVERQPYTPPAAAQAAGAPATTPPTGMAGTP